MSVRLINISKKLGVGTNTLVEFLQAKGMDATVNTKIDEATHEILIGEFGKPSDLQELKHERVEKEKKIKNKPERTSVEENSDVLSKSSDVDISVKDSLTQEMPHFKIVDKIDLNPKNKKVKSTEEQVIDKGQVDDVSSPKLPEPKVEKKVSAKEKKEEAKVSVVDKPVESEKVEVSVPKVVSEKVIDEQPTQIEPTDISVKTSDVTSAKPSVNKESVRKEPNKEANQSLEKEPKLENTIEEQNKQVISKSNENKENQNSEIKEQGSVVAKINEQEEIFRFREPTVEPQLVIKGTIDLDTINDKTRPAKKTKLEKKKDRERTDRNPKELISPNANAEKTIKKDLVKKQPGDDDLDAKKKKRNRIKKGLVDIESGAQTESTANNAPSAKPKNLNKANPQANSGNNHNANRNKKVFNKPAVSDEDVQRQIKETLARLTDNKKSKNKGARYRKEKRDAQFQKVQDNLDTQERESKILKITEFVTANDLASMMDIPVVQVIQTCMSIGMMVSINQRLDAETINIVVNEFGFETEYVSAEVIDAIAEEVDAEEDLVPRPPIVTVMGHVDHGKTSLLDYVRQTNVIAGEAGGITQHIGAYNVKLKSGRAVTFLDTPGHEAFTAMRARGAQITDIAVIIIAADDNVMPQTKEAINHAAAAGVPIVFAINKVDKPSANPEKIKETLAGMNYLVEDWGGKYQSQEISAKKGLGVDELLEKILLEADLLDLKANPNRRAVGSVVESSLDKGRGYTSTILVQNGTMRVGDIILAGTSHGRVRAMFNERNQVVQEAKPSEPVQILGLNGAPQAGDLLHVLETEQEAKEISTKREQLQREQGLRTQKILTLDDIGRRIAIGNFQQINLIVKADMDGSVEALSDSLLKLSTPEIQLNVIHKGVGQISESDVTLAAASDAIIVGFQVRPSLQARKLAESDGVDIRLYSIIYDAIEEIKSAMEGMLSPEIRETVTGYVEVREVFKITKVGTVAGCFVREGKLKKTNKIRLIRDGIVIYSGQLGSLKRFKDEAKEVFAGQDCGLNITNYNDIKVGDVIEPFDETEIKKTL